jgi:hypothetical protein
MRSVPVQLLPNGKYIYQDPGGTFSHQHPIEAYWCERHRTMEEALNCYILAEQSHLKPPAKT